VAVHQRARRRRCREHVLDSFFGFLAALGISERLLRWDLPLPGAARAYAERLIPDARPTLVISPCSSHALRNWRPTRYAALAQHAAGRLRMRVILAGGPSELERAPALKSSRPAAARSLTRSARTRCRRCSRCCRGRACS